MGVLGPDVIQWTEPQKNDESNSHGSCDAIVFDHGARVQPTDTEAEIP